MASWSRAALKCLRVCACVLAAVPSPPQNVISSVNETSLSLEWEEPADDGGRSDVIFNVVCKKCLRERSPCTRCDDNVDVAPRRLGLTDRKVVVRNLQAHTRYSFEVQAVNGVSGKSPSAPSYSTARGIFPDQGPNPCPLHWQADSQPLRHQGSQIGRAHV